MLEETQMKSFACASEPTAVFYFECGTVFRNTECLLEDPY